MSVPQVHPGDRQRVALCKAGQGGRHCARGAHRLPPLRRGTSMRCSVPHSPGPFPRRPLRVRRREAFPYGPPPPTALPHGRGCPNSPPPLLVRSAPVLSTGRLGGGGGGVLQWVVAAAAAISGPMSQRNAGMESQVHRMFKQVSNASATAVLVAPALYLCLASRPPIALQDRHALTGRVCQCTRAQGLPLRKGGHWAGTPTPPSPPPPASSSTREQRDPLSHVTCQPPKHVPPTAHRRCPPSDPHEAPPAVPMSTPPEPPSQSRAQAGGPAQTAPQAPNVRRKDREMAVECVWAAEMWGGGGGGLARGHWLPLAAPIGLSPLHMPTLCGSERVLVVSMEPPDDLSCLTTPGVGRPGDGDVAPCR